MRLALLALGRTAMFLGIPELLAALGVYEGLKGLGMGSHDPRQNETEDALRGSIENFEAYKKAHPSDRSSFAYKTMESAANQLRKYRREQGMVMTERRKLLNAAERVREARGVADQGAAAQPKMLRSSQAPTKGAAVRV